VWDREVGLAAAKDAAADIAGGEELLIRESFVRLDDPQSSTTTRSSTSGTSTRKLSSERRR
jgi:hypothetical protein